MQNILLPSILSANFYNLKEDFEILQNAGCTHLHVDVMDGIFVPNISLGIPVIKSIDDSTDMILDCHLMIAEPDRYLENFKNAGADIITIHYEASNDPASDLKSIQKMGLKSGISIKPNTNVNSIYPLLDLGIVDMVLIMSVEPGFGGQSFIESSLIKIKELKSYINQKNLNINIEVDGGICADNIERVVSAGANMLVAGSAVFKGNIESNFRDLNQIIGN